MGKLLIIADIDNACFATPRGLELAAKLGHSAEVVAFTYVTLKRSGLKASEQPAIKKRLIEERQAEVQARIDKYCTPGQKVTLKVVWSEDVAPWIAKRCATASYAVVVKTGHRSESLMYTSTDWQLLRELSTPVLIVAERKWHRTKPVLAALDLSSKSAAKQALNKLVLATAKVWSEALGAELKVISAIEVPTLLADLDLVDPLAYAAAAKDSMKPHVRALAAAEDLPEVLFRSKRGPVAKVITSDAAKVRAQLVVMGTVGRKGVQARLLGNTAESVLRHLNTDVLAIKP